MRKGVVYIASGKKFIDEARQSASSLKDRMPELNITIISDDKVEDKCFDKWIFLKKTENVKLYKIAGMPHSPYEHTLFLDTDTYVCSDLSEIFTLLQKYDIGVAQAELRAGKNLLGESYNYQQSIDCDGRFIFPIYNSGVIIYKKSPEIEKFFKDWFSLAEQQMQEKGTKYGDQPSFQLSLHKSNLREVVLTPEYNCRFVFPVCVSGIVKILHGRHPDLPAIAKEINSEISTRLFHPRWGLILDRKSQMLKKVLTNQTDNFL
ncbi:MAG: hypothetical protein ACHBN1_20300 [Heteroscytonema crispum UTEX LB 1556]